MADSTHYSRNGFLTKLGLEQAAQRFSLEGLALRSEAGYLDKVGSVSALVEVEDLYADLEDKAIDEQYRRFHSGR